MVDVYYTIGTTMASRLVSPCLPLDKLTELAIIATGPQSPLLQDCNNDPSSEIRFSDVKSFDYTIHSYAKPPRTPTPPLLLVKPGKPYEDSNNNTNATVLDSECNKLIYDCQTCNNTPLDIPSNLWTTWDSNAALALSNMAKSHSLLYNTQKQGSSSAPTTPVKKRHKSTSSKLTSSSVGKRPMNAFMLFAKRFRLEYTQQHPGKDNRAISVILGDKWRQLCKDERQAFAQEARLMADECKKINPDCWKRKRSQSASAC